VAQVMSLVLLNLAGGTRVEDIERLEQDPGLRRVMLRIQWAALPRAERRAKERSDRLAQRRGVQERAFPSPSAIFRYLEEFHHPDTDRLRQEALEREGRKAFIPPELEGLQALYLVLRQQLAVLAQHVPCTTATLDMDATLIQTTKAAALHSYKGYVAYQPLNFFWHELGVVVYSQFRDGNVPAGYGLLAPLQRALEQLPESVQRVLLRSDTAGYTWDLLRYCAEGRHPRFGRIDFAVSADVTPELKQEVAKLPPSAWHSLVRRYPDGQEVVTDQEVAEVVYVPDAAARTKRGANYRFLVTREPLQQLELPGLAPKPQQELPFPTMDLRDAQQRLLPYKLHAVVTTLAGPAADIIWWARGRCGKSEEAHAVMKEDLAGGTLPSGRFGANAAWWAIMLLAHNLNVMMKRLVLGAGWVHRRLKAVRFHLIHLAARVVSHADTLVLKLASAAFALLQRVRTATLALAPPS
jgi:hypothetical protein